MALTLEKIEELYWYGMRNIESLVEQIFKDIWDCKIDNIGWSFYPDFYFGIDIGTIGWILGNAITEQLNNIWDIDLHVPEHPNTKEIFTLGEIHDIEVERLIISDGKTFEVQIYPAEEPWEKNRIYIEYLDLHNNHIDEYADEDYEFFEKILHNLAEKYLEASYIIINKPLDIIEKILRTTEEYMRKLEAIIYDGDEENKDVREIIDDIRDLTDELYEEFIKIKEEAYKILDKEKTYEEITNK